MVYLNKNPVDYHEIQRYINTLFLHIPGMRHYCLKTAPFVITGRVQIIDPFDNQLILKVFQTYPLTSSMLAQILII